MSGRLGKRRGRYGERSERLEPTGVLGCGGRQQSHTPAHWIRCDNATSPVEQFDRLTGRSFGTFCHSLASCPSGRQHWLPRIRLHHRRHHRDLPRLSSYSPPKSRPSDESATARNRWDSRCCRDSAVHLESGFLLRTKYRASPAESGFADRSDPADHHPARCPPPSTPDCSGTSNRSKHPPHDPARDSGTLPGTDPFSDAGSGRHDLVCSQESKDARSTLAEFAPPQRRQYGVDTRRPSTLSNPRRNNSRIRTKHQRRKLPIHHHRRCHGRWRNLRFRNRLRDQQLTPPRKT